MAPAQANNVEQSSQNVNISKSFIMNHFVNFQKEPFKSQEASGT